MIEFLNNFDTTIFLAVNGAHSPFFDSFMTMFTGRFIWIPMYAMVAWILYRNCPARSATIYLVALVAAIFLTDQTCATVIRPAVERMRPSNIENTLSQFTYIVDGYRGGSYGFPSCHAANSFALTVFIALFVRRRGFTLFIVSWALLNSYSRLYLGVHYPGDLLAGAIVGSLFGLICYRLATVISRRIGAPADDRLPQVRLKQLTPGASLRSLTPVDTSLLPVSGHSQRGVLTATTGYGLMMAVFAATLTVIIIASALR